MQTTVARTIQACGGGTSTVGPLRREYRASRRAAPADPVAAIDIDEYCRRLQNVLDFVAKTHPIIRADSRGPSDAAADIRAGREARDRAIARAVRGDDGE